MPSPSETEFWTNLHSLLALRRDYAGLLKSFEKLQSDADRVKMVSPFLKSLNVTPSSFGSSCDRPDKDTNWSVTLRTRGNSAFQRKKDKLALKLYTESIAYAPLPVSCGSDDAGTPEDDPTLCALSLGFANRSAVLFCSRQYAACLADIELAMKYNYPRSLRYKLLERKGKCLTHQGKLAEAGNCFEEAVHILSSTSESDLKKSSVENSIRELQEQLKSVKLSSEVPKPEQQHTLPSKSYGQHEYILSASKCVDIQYSPDKGRFLQANRNIRPGDIIIIEKPYVSVLKPEKCKMHCYNCLIRHDALIPCLKCPEVMYCSESCRSQSWQECHQIECQMMAILRNNLAFHVALKIILKASSCGKKLLELCNVVKKLEKDSRKAPKYLGFDEKGLYKSDEYAAIYHQFRNTSKIKKDYKFLTALSVALCLNCLEEKTSFFINMADTPDFPQVRAVIGGLLLRHVQNLQFDNYFNVANYILSDKPPGVQFLGSAVHATLSLLNHSCDPNVIKIDHRGDTAVLRAFRPIKAGDEILISYGSHYSKEVRAVRQFQLQSRSYFTCHCEPCTSDWPLIENCSPWYKCPHCGHALMSEICSHCKILCDLGELHVKNSRYSAQLKEIMRRIDAGNRTSVEVDLQNLLERWEDLIQRPFGQYYICQCQLETCFLMASSY